VAIKKEIKEKPTKEEKITIIDKNSGIKEEYSKEQLEGTKEVLSLRGKDARVDLNFLENGGAYLFVENNILKKSTFVALTRNDIEWIVYFILKNNANITKIVKSILEVIE